MFCTCTNLFPFRLIAEYFSVHLRSVAKDFEDQHGGYGYLVKKKEEQRILEFCAAMNMGVGNGLFLKKRVNHLVTFEFGPS